MTAPRPSQPPDFDAKTFCKLLVANQPITPALQTQFINRKRWLESTSTYDGVAKGGLRDILDALVEFTNSLKTDSDHQAGQIANLSAEVAELSAEVKAAQANRPPFP